MLQQKTIKDAGHLQLTNPSSSFWRAIDGCTVANERGRPCRASITLCMTCVHVPTLRLLMFPVNSQGEISLASISQNRPQSLIISLSVAPRNLFHSVMSCFQAQKERPQIGDLASLVNFYDIISKLQSNWFSNARYDYHPYLQRDMFASVLQ